MILILAEKPSVARDIANALPGQKQNQKTHIVAGNYIVTWGFGHLVTLYDARDYNPEYQIWKIETLPIIPKKFLYKPIPSSAHQLKAIRDIFAKNQIDEVILATDADREGELLGRLILNECGWKGPIKRFWTSEALTPDVVKRTLQSLKDGRLYDNLYEEGLARQHADWIVGINETRALTVSCNAKQVISVGRVQTALLSILAEREKQIQNFKSQKYWCISTIVKLNDEEITLQLAREGKALSFRSIDDPYDQENDTLEEDDIKENNKTVKPSKSPMKFASKEDAQKVAQLLLKSQIKVVNVHTTSEKEQPPKLFALSDLQKEANKLYGMSSSTVLGVAQALYEEHKVISYPRTSCQFMASSNENLVKAVLKEFGYPSERVNKTVFNDKKVSEAGHHALIPLRPKSMSNRPMSENEKKIFDLITRKFLAASIGTPYITEKTYVTCEADGFILYTQSTACIDPGWHKYYPPNWKPPASKPLSQIFTSYINKNITAKDTPVHEHETAPPPRYTEGVLISLMKNAWKLTKTPELQKVLRESRGIGTEATRASIIDTLKERGYIAVRNRSIVVTPLGMSLYDLVKKLDLKVANITLTALWEDKLSKIGKGQIDYNTFIREIIQTTREEVNTIVGKVNSSSIQTTRVKCLSCSNEVEITPKGAFCKCGVKVWRDFMGKKLTDEQLEKLVEGKAVTLKNLKGKSGKTFDASLKLNPNSKQIEMSFPNKTTQHKPKIKQKVKTESNLATPKPYPNPKPPRP